MVSLGLGPGYYKCATLLFIPQASRTFHLFEILC